MEYRKATIADLFLYFAWVNDEDVIKNSIQQKKITLEEHTNWFENAIGDPQKLLLMFSVNGTPAGQVRIEKKGAENILSVSLDKNFRGRGYAKEIIRECCREFAKQTKEPVQAYVNELNIASGKSFLKAGFKFTGQEEITGNCFNKYEYRP